VKNDRAERDDECLSGGFRHGGHIVRAELCFRLVRDELFEGQIFSARYGMKTVVEPRHRIRVGVACTRARFTARLHGG
jgi:hypothetical protein